MSEEASLYAWARVQEPDGIVTAPTLLTLLCIARQADSEGVLHRSRNDLAFDRGVDTRTITRHTTALNEEGLLSVFEGTEINGATHWNTYVVPIANPQDRVVAPQVQGESKGVPGGHDNRVPPTPSPVGSEISKENGSTDEEQFTLTLADVQKEPLPNVSIDGHPLLREEWDVAQVAIKTFNECNGGSRLVLIGTRGGATDSLRRIVCRQRDFPHLTPEDHDQLVRRNFENPWWSEDKLTGIGPIYGPNVFERALANTGKPGKRRTRSRRFAAERGPDGKPGEERTAW